MQKIYDNIKSIAGPILVVDGVKDAKYEELVEVQLTDGTVKMGKVLESTDGRAMVQMFESTQGLSTTGLKAKFTGKVAQLGVSPDMLGRVFNGAGKPLDGGVDVLPEKIVDISGMAINPYSRKFPSDFIQTGVSSIDVMNTLVRGQKLPIFSVQLLQQREDF